MNDKDLFGEDANKKEIDEPISDCLHRKSKSVPVATEVDKSLDALIRAIKNETKAGTCSHEKMFLRERLISDVIMIQVGIDKLTQMK